jgi:hypothetical protein
MMVGSGLSAHVVTMTIAAPNPLQQQQQLKHCIMHAVLVGPVISQRLCFVSPLYCAHFIARFLTLLLSCSESAWLLLHTGPARPAGRSRVRRRHIWSRAQEAAAVCQVRHTASVHNKGSKHAGLQPAPLQVVQQLSVAMSVSNHSTAFVL